MKKRYFSCTALVLTFCMLLLAAGCGVRINGKDYTIFNAPEKDKNNNIIEGIAGGLGSETISSSRVVEEAGDGETLSIENNAGNIKIIGSDNTKIIIDVHKKVRGISSKDRQNIFDNMNVSLERDGKNLKVVVKTKDGKEFWQWQKQEVHLLSGSIDFDLTIPKSIKEINSETGAGNININGVTSKITAETGAGNIDVNNVSATGSSSLETGTGNVEFNGKFDNITSFKATTGVGNVEFSVSEDTKMNLDAETGIGHLSGYFVKSENGNKTHFTGGINGGGPEVKLNTGVGNVKADER
ncbi:MAG TPA: hypothetical protein VHP38_14815 [Ruminiclostridium sp.]|nr:hypothetical protein [Ruminiclostridium sp.]